jgi:hypothetical protein
LAIFWQENLKFYQRFFFLFRKLFIISRISGEKLAKFPYIDAKEEQITKLFEKKVHRKFSKMSASLKTEYFLIFA